jgi:hypothetical protein
MIRAAIIHWGVLIAVACLVLEAVAMFVRAIRR